MPKSIVLKPQGLRIPGNITFLDSFRSWVSSPSFPEDGRIDFLAGEVEIDTTPEDITTHGTPKSAIVSTLHRLIVEERDSGMVLTDRSRLTSPVAELSCEPDVLVVLDESLAAGRVRLVPRVGGQEPGRFTELEGGADLVVECLSDSSVKKDVQVLFDLYEKARVREYWVVDARQDPAKFEVFTLSDGKYDSTAADKSGFVPSAVLGRAFRLVRRARPGDVVVFVLEARDC